MLDCGNGAILSLVTASRWHVSPVVDVSAYAFSWVFILIPLAYFSSREHQVVMLLMVVGLTFAHRHYTLPYVYLDREIFDTHPKRFMWFPLLMLIGFLASPALWNTRGRIVVAAGRFRRGRLERLARVHAEIRPAASVRREERQFDRKPTVGRPGPAFLLGAALPRVARTVISRPDRECVSHRSRYCAYRWSTRWLERFRFCSFLPLLAWSRVSASSCTTSRRPSVFAMPRGSRWRSARRFCPHRF